jgi:hypothetical protein
MQDVGNENAFIPCQSPCARYNLGIYCCTGKYNSPRKCHANYYAVKAKEVCPDAYSFAYDDATSTFTAPTGSGFELVFCPGGRSTTILRTLNPSSASTRGPGGVLVVTMLAVAVFFVMQ